MRVHVLIVHFVFREKPDVIEGALLAPFRHRFATWEKEWTLGGVVDDLINDFLGK